MSFLLTHLFPAITFTKIDFLLTFKFEGSQISHDYIKDENFYMADVKSWWGLYQKHQNTDTSCI